jgi:hypothetical protein
VIHIRNVFRDEHHDSMAGTLCTAVILLEKAGNLRGEEVVA